jgi:hypothetical protein
MHCSNYPIVNYLIDAVPTEKLGIGWEIHLYESWIGKDIKGEDRDQIQGPVWPFDWIKSRRDQNWVRPE